MLTPEREALFAEKFVEPEVNYNLLREGVQSFLFESNKSENERKDTEAILRMYTTFTDKMVGIADGSIEYRDIEDPDNPELSRQKPDAMIFLDKSARPVSWFMDAFWDQFAKEGSEKPEFDFLNIDRTNWFMSQGHRREIAERFLGPSDFDIEKVSKEDLARIRAQFVVGDIDEATWQDEVWNMPTTLDGKNVVIVDEVKSQGGTLSIATQLLKRALPESTVSGSYFWESDRRLVNNGKELQIDSVPVWYDATDQFGRGIGDISQTYYERQYDKEQSQDNLRHKIGWKVLSAPHFNVDTNELLEDRKANALMQDISFLSYAVASGRVLRQPSTRREDDDFIAIVEEQGLTPRESVDWKNRSKQIRKRYASKVA